MTKLNIAANVLQLSDKTESLLGKGGNLSFFHEVSKSSHFQGLVDQELCGKGLRYFKK